MSNITVLRPATRLSRALVYLLLLLTGACTFWGEQPPVASTPGQFLPGDGLPKGGSINLATIPDAIPVNLPLSKTGNRPYTVFGRQYRPLKSAKAYRAEGMASWYGTKFHGRKTASGEAYDMYAMSAAHRTLPLPSFLRVTNLSNQRSVIVKVNDRGPFVNPDQRIVDLSYAAASRLGIVATGTARVRLEAVVPDDASDGHMPLSEQSSFLQIEAFKRYADAERLLTRLSEAGISAYIVQSSGAYNVKSGPYADADQALQYKMEIDRLLELEARVVFER